LAAAPNSTSTNATRSSEAGSSQTGAFIWLSATALPCAVRKAVSASVTRWRAAVSLARTDWHFAVHAFSLEDGRAPYAKRERRHAAGGNESGGRADEHD
jgi:hypothetical protein